MNRAQLYDQDGHPVRLGRELGEGGEGAVFELANVPGLVAKVYHHPVRREKAAKLAAMVLQKSGGLIEVAAWPVGILFSAPGAIAGLLMPKVSGFKAVHVLYGPKSRLAEFPQANWTFLVHAAANVARALAVLHAAGNVVGDINHGNILVSSRALAKLIDCDSFQIRSGGRCFLCEVGVPTHTPPELQGLNFHTVTRTPNHDAFGLAVVLFQLLFLGRHPFSGTYLRAGEMPLERAIQEHRFAYGREAAARQMRQPPHTPPLAIASPAVAALFERAFSPQGVRDGGRPLPHEWVAALEGLEIQTCPLRPAHTYAATLDGCPWCALEITTGMILFKGPRSHAAAADAAGGFDIRAAWARIAAVTPPGPLPPLPADPLTPQLFARLVQLVRARTLGMTLLLLTSLGLALAQGGATLWGIAASGLIFLGIAVTDLTVAAFARRAVGRLDALKETWQQQAGSAYQAVLQNLDQVAQAYLKLPAVRRHQLAQLAEGLRKRQLERHLDLHPIRGSGLEGLAPVRLAALQSYGVETAADVVEAGLRRVPGLDRPLIDRLLGWRRQLEDGFVFDPSQGVEHDDLVHLSEALDKTERELEQELLAGPEQLRRSVESVRHRQQALLAQIEAAMRKRDQAVQRLRKLFKGQI